MFARLAVQAKAAASDGPRGISARPSTRPIAVSDPSDRHEREADRIADEVMSGAASAKAACGCHGGAGPSRIQAKSVSVSASVGQVPATVVDAALGSPGQALPAATREHMESRFGHDFRDVRIHDNSAAAESSRALRARAYTAGSSIVFGAGQYQPSSPSGQRLIAHELAHMIQQREHGSTPVIQRSITLTDPGGTPPHPPGAMGPFPSKAFTLRGWLQTLCPDGNWNVDGATGVVDSPDRGTFCAAATAAGRAHVSTTAHRTSCQCLCELTAPGSRTVAVQIDENLTIGATRHALVPQGEAATAHISATDKISGFTGRSFVGITGAGATAPLAGAGRTQTIPDPPWIIFGHEVCGHARLQTGPMGATAVGHSATQAGNVTTVDIENRIRREHSTIASSLGIRRGTFNARNAAGIMTEHTGSILAAGPGDTIATIATRCGIAAPIIDHIWRFNGDRVTAATVGTLAAAEQLLIEGIDWHEVITGETMASIATMWGVPEASLRRANPSIVAPFTVRRGDRLLIPAS